MTSRVLMGRHPNLSGNPHGLFVSKTGQPVTGTTLSNFAFMSNLTDSTSGITSLNGQTLTVKHRGSVTVNLNSTGSGSRIKTINVFTWNRSDFNDGSVDRCPLVFVQTSVITATNIQNAVGYLNFRNSTLDYISVMGFHFEIFPYFTTTTGKVTCNITGEAYANSSGVLPTINTGDRKIYYAVCSTNVS